MHSPIVSALIAGLTTILFSVSIAAGQEIAPSEGMSPLAFPATPEIDGGADAAAPDGQTTAALPFRFASVVGTNDKPGKGDIVMVSRGFDSWMMKCQLRLSTNKRVCRAEQTLFDLTDSENRIYWVIASTEDDKPVLLIQMPGWPDFDTKTGLRLELGQTSLVLNQGWRCGQRCAIPVVFDGEFQYHFLKSETVTLHYSYRGENKVTAAPIDGLADVLKAAAEDPFGMAQLKAGEARRMKNMAAN